MSWLEALVLGIVQGLTEFLPVSSSGHLELVKALMREEDMPAEGLLFTIVVHAATAFSTIVVYRKDIFEILAGVFKFQWNDETKFAAKIVVSIIPAAIVGLAFEEQIESLFIGNILLVGMMLLVTGFLLLLGDLAKRTDKSVKFHHAFIIGVSQAIAILPGISRSGATISTAVLLGIDREKTARFSFLIVVPLILGKLILDTGELMEMGETGSEEKLSGYIIGFFAAFISGIIACKWMISLVKKARLIWFAIYCFIVGALAVIFTLL